MEELPEYVKAYLITQRLEINHEEYPWHEPTIINRATLYFPILKIKINQDWSEYKTISEGEMETVYKNGTNQSALKELRVDEKKFRELIALQKTRDEASSHLENKIKEIFREITQERM